MLNTVFVMDGLRDEKILLSVESKVFTSYRGSWINSSMVFSSVTLLHFVL